MTHPYLIVSAGCPSAGKSSIGDALQDRGFVRLSVDEVRDELFDNPDFLTYRAAPDFNDNETRVAEVIYDRKIQALSDGKNVYLDSCADLAEWRRGLLHTGNIQADKYILELQVEEDILRERNLARGRPNDAYREWRERWEPIQPGEANHLVYQNNTPEDLEFMVEDLKQRLYTDV